MPLVTMEKMLKHAKANKYAVPAFNLTDMNALIAAAQAAEEEDAPIIIAGLEYGGPDHGRLDVWTEAAKCIARSATVPMAIHLDHGPSYEMAVRCIQLGFTSVMIDASTKPYEENVAITREVVKLAHAVGVTVEGEIGHVGQGTDELTEEKASKLLTKPEEALRYVKDTGVDAVAVSIGNQHGVYKFTPNIHWDLLENLVKEVPAYIVMHGGSGTPGLEKAARMGVTKINIGTDIGMAYVDSLPGVIKAGPFGLFAAPQEAVKKVLVGRIREFNANGKGRDLIRKM